MLPGHHSLPLYHCKPREDLVIGIRAGETYDIVRATESNIATSKRLQLPFP
jgi:hypothetical protein